MSEKSSVSPESWRPTQADKLSLAPKESRSRQSCSGCGVVRAFVQLPPPFQDSSSLSWQEVEVPDPCSWIAQADLEPSMTSVAVVGDRAGAALQPEGVPLLGAVRGGRGGGVEVVVQAVSPRSGWSTLRWPAPRRWRSPSPWCPPTAQCVTSGGLRRPQELPDTVVVLRAAHRDRQDELRLRRPRGRDGGDPDHPHEVRAHVGRDVDDQTAVVVRVASTSRSSSR